jgi:hypothetical protein
LIGLATSEVGLLSLTVAAAYWAVPGAGAAAAAGVLLVAIGVAFILKFWRRSFGRRLKSGSGRGYA